MSSVADSYPKKATKVAAQEAAHKKRQANKVKKDKAAAIQAKKDEGIARLVAAANKKKIKDDEAKARKAAANR